LELGFEELLTAKLKLQKNNFENFERDARRLFMAFSLKNFLKS